MSLWQYSIWNIRVYPGVALLSHRVYVDLFSPNTTKLFCFAFLWSGIRLNIYLQLAIQTSLPWNANYVPSSVQFSIESFILLFPLVDLQFLEHFLCILYLPKAQHRSHCSEIADLLVCLPYYSITQLPEGRKSLISFDMPWIWLGGGRTMNIYCMGYGLDELPTEAQVQ